MNSLATRLTRHMEAKGIISADTFEVYQYGFEIALEMTACFLGGIFIAIYLDLFLEFFIVTILLVSLRSYTGGWHMNSFFGCFVCSNIMVTGIMYINREWTLSLQYSWIIIILSMVTIYTIAPVNHVNRMIEKSEIKYLRRQLRRVCVWILGGVVILTVMKMTYYVSIISISMLGVFLAAVVGKIEFGMKTKENTSK